MTESFPTLTPMKYRAILCDPPWAFKLYSPKGEQKSPQAHYACMSHGDLLDLPVGQLAAPDCLIVMWATFPMIGDALKLMKAWGFTYKTGGAWAKQSRTGTKWAFGAGYVLRSAAEPFLIGTIGRPAYKSKSIRNLIVAPVREHSRKPDAMHENIEAMVDGPYLELFARAGRPGWDVWGNETAKFEAA
jgi:N6-adenosine-specific RNA methylase IME4